MHRALGVLAVEHIAEVDIVGQHGLDAQIERALLLFICHKVAAAEDIHQL